MVGVAFRPQGHVPATGLDCVGLVWAAYARGGAASWCDRLDYPLRGWSRAQIETGLIGGGVRIVRRPGAMRPGDVALIAFDAGQFHLGLIGVGNALFMRTPDCGGWSRRRSIRRRVRRRGGDFQ